MKEEKAVWDDKPVDVSAEVNFIWQVATLLHGVSYKDADHRDVILPMTVLRRLECALASTKDAVVEYAAKNPNARIWTVGWPDESHGWNRGTIDWSLKPVIKFQEKYGARIYVGEFSAVAWAPGAGDYLRDCISVFNEHSWDWTYHAFREWAGWSVEHAGEDDASLRPSADNPRKRALLDGLKEYLKGLRK